MTFSRSVGSSILAAPQSVWCMTATRVTSSWFTDFTSERSTSSVTRAPALRSTWASPGVEPEDRQRVDAGVHAGDHGDVAPGRSGEAAEVEPGGVLGVGGEEVGEGVHGADRRGTVAARTNRHSGIA